jgi:pyruvate/2-oxoglutarate dehydrogenase complex dihydrolipoamide acyltransferase (E2) component
MPYQFLLSGIGNTTEEGVVVAWFKREGAAVQEGEPLLEVQVAKTSYEVPAPVSGRLHRIVAPRDTIVKEGQLLALLLLRVKNPKRNEKNSRKKENLRVHIRALRRTWGIGPEHSELILAEQRVGYRMAASDSLDEPEESGVPSHSIDVTRRG